MLPTWGSHIHLDECTRARSGFFLWFSSKLKNIGAENTAVNQSRTLGEHPEVWSACVVETSL